ncbi:MAG: hypothetical protein V9F05_19205 [Chitinophagaceae bacterium]
MLDKNSNMIWYACYGSNMDNDKFIKYIQGGELTVNGHEKNYIPCPTDTEPARQSEQYLIDRRFYFAKESTTWNKHGVGFISPRRSSRSRTYARIYLISRAQFSHLFAQENSRQTAQINYENLNEKGFLDFEYSFYNRIIQLEENLNGCPVLTFTNKSILLPNKPLKEYVRLICKGLRLTHNLSDKNIFEYLSKKGTGINKKELFKLLKQLN